MPPDSRLRAHTRAVTFIIKEVNETTEWHPEPSKRTVEIERNKIYKANLMWCWEHSKKLLGQTHFVIARGSGSHVDIYKNIALKDMLASYPAHWFEHFEAVDQSQKIESVETASDQVVEESIFDPSEEPAFFEQMKLF